MSGALKEVEDGVTIGYSLARYPAYIMFFSKSKSALGKYLSNFHLSPVKYRKLTFPSVEHAYQAAKFLFADDKQRGQELFATLAVGGQNGKLTSPQAKSFGGKGSWKRLGLQLNIREWSKHEVKIMKTLLKSRLKHDKLFRQIIRKAQRESVALLHNDRAAAKSFWGGAFDPQNRSHFRGQNTLGLLMMRL